MKGKLIIFNKSGIPMSSEVYEVPTLKEGEILIKNEYTTLCRSDISTYLGHRIEKSPTILGHEIVGRIVTLGENIENVFDIPLHVGERVTWAIYAANPKGPMALKGMPQKSPDLFKYGHEQVTDTSLFHGGLGEYTILRRYTPVLPLAENIPLPVASIINCAVSTVAGSLRLAGELSNKRIGIWGTGMLGVIACAMCKVKGAQAVIGIDKDKSRLNTALRFGATSVYTPQELEASNESVDIAIDYSGCLQSMEAGPNHLSIGGTAVWVGGVCPQDKVRIDSEKVIRRLYTIKGLHNYNADDFKEGVNFITKYWSQYPISELIYDGFTLDQTEEAFQYAISHNPYRVGIRIGSDE